MNTTHVHGLPSTTFQSILQNISTRIQLYELSAKRTYNHRAISTLAVESMFSSLSMLTSNNSGIPLATNIPRYISKLTQFANIQQNPNKFINTFHLIIIYNYKLLKHAYLQICKIITIDYVYCRNFEMRLLKRNNYPAYTLNNPNNIILQDSNGIPLMISHKFDQQELGFRVKKWRKDDINFGNAPLCGMLPL